MAKKGGGTPTITPIDPAASAKAQAEANRVTQITPAGSLVFGNLVQGPDGALSVNPNVTPGQAAAEVIETPFQQAFRSLGEDTALTIGGQIAATAGALPPSVSTEGLPDLPGGIDFSGLPSLTSDFSGDRANVEQAVFQRAKGLLEPEFETAERRLLTRLATQGLPAGGEAYTSELERFDRGRGEAMNKAALDAIAAGGAEQSRLFNLALSGRGQGISEQLQDAQLGLQTRAQGLGEQQAIRGGVLSELASIIGGQGFNPTPTTSFIPPGGVDVLGAQQLAQNAQMANAQASAQRQQSQNAGLFGIGSALAGSILPAIALSSRAIKHDNRPVASVLPRIVEMPIEAWKYRFDPDQRDHIGPYAEDFQRLFGVGDGKTIVLMDAVGVLFKGAQETAALLSDALARIAALEGAR